MSCLQIVINILVIRNIWVRMFWVVRTNKNTTHDLTITNIPLQEVIKINKVNINIKTKLVAEEKCLREDHLRKMALNILSQVEEVKRKEKITFFRCNKIGHYAFDCRIPY